MVTLWPDFTFHKGRGGGEERMVNYVEKKGVGLVRGGGDSGKRGGTYIILPNLSSGTVQGRDSMISLDNKRDSKRKRT